MDFFTELRASRTSPATVYHSYMLNMHDCAVQMFIEGRDEPFYRYAIARLDPSRKINPYRCGNKQGVYDILEKLTRLGKITSDCVFFVDKDHSDILKEVLPQNERLYATDNYSIENYLITDEMFCCWYQDFVRLNNIQFNISILERKFNEEYKRFVRFVRPLAAWVIAARRKSLRVNTANICLENVVDFSMDGSMERQRARMDHIEKATGVSPGAVSWREVRSEIGVLRSIGDHKIWLRGHWDAWFFVWFSLRLIDILKGSAKEVGASVSVKTVIHEGNFLEVLGPRARFPQPLLDFLEDRLGLKPSAMHPTGNP